MRRLFVFAIMLTLCAGVAFMLRSAAPQDSFPNLHDDPAQTGAAFRDGLYQGELAARRGSTVHIASGRWATGADRSSFTNGYQQAYIESFSADRQAALATDVAFRDGLYLGELAARRGEEPRISEGRWSNQADRASFKAGYQQGYNELIALRAATLNRTR